MNFLSLFLFLRPFLISNINIFLSKKSVKKHDAYIESESYKSLEKMVV